MKFSIDEESLNLAAEEAYKNLQVAKNSMDKMGLPGDNSIRAMVVSAYILGAKAAIEKVNESADG